MENHLNKAGRNATSDNSYLRRPTHRSPTSQCWARMINALQRVGFRQRSMKLGSRMDNACNVDHPNIKHCGAWNIHSPNALKTLLFQETENNSNATAPSIVNEHENILSFAQSSSAGEDGWTRTWIVVIVYKGVDGNIGGNSTASDFTEAEGCLREPESCHVESMFVWNGKTGFIAQCPRSPDTGRTRRIAANTSTHRLQCYKHLYISSRSQ